MSDRAVRVTFQRNDDANEGMHVDVVLSGTQLKRGQEYFGVWFDNTEGTRCPFILNRDGQLDYGAGYEDEDQFYGTELLGLNYAEGAGVTVTFEDETIGYKIAKITPLA
jgi:hypothetical protein